MSAALVLSTVNAPHSHPLTAQELAFCLKNPAAARAVPGHMSSFLGEVSPALQIEFAAQFGITEAELIAAAKDFSAYFGAPYHLIGTSPWGCYLRTGC